MTVSNWFATPRCGVLGGLALLFAFPAIADSNLHKTIRLELQNESYVLVEDQRGIRLFVFSSEGDGFSTTLAPVAPGSMDEALALTRSEIARERVRGLTTLAGEPDEEALNAALALLADPNVAVREEAVNLIIDHPHGDLFSIVAAASADSSPRVRDAVQDLIDDAKED